MDSQDQAGVVTRNDDSDPTAFYLPKIARVSLAISSYFNRVGQNEFHI